MTTDPKEKSPDELPRSPGEWLLSVVPIDTEKKRKRMGKLDYKQVQKLVEYFKAARIAFEKAHPDD